jgi:predicted ribonuclease YlaK
LPIKINISKSFFQFRNGFTDDAHQDNRPVDLVVDILAEEDKLAVVDTQKDLAVDIQAEADIPVKDLAEVDTQEELAEGFLEDFAADIPVKDRAVDNPEHLVEDSAVDNLYQVVQHNPV